jgi:hypothetical protein
VDEYLPVALLHLREVEIVRLCGLTRAARGQEHIRTNQVRQPERTAGTLQGTVLDGEQARAAMAHFSDVGLDSWACSCISAPADASPSLDQPSQATAGRQPCEHIAALLYFWVRAPEAFHVPADTPQTASPPTSGVSQVAIPAKQAPPTDRQPQTPPPTPTATDPNVNATSSTSANGSANTAKNARLVPGIDDPPDHLPRILPLLPLVPSAGESGAAQSVAMLGQAAVPPGEMESKAPKALPPDAGVHEEQASSHLPTLLLLVVAQAVDQTAPVPNATTAQKPGARAAPDPDSALLRHRAQQLNIPPEQIRFCFALLRLIGLLPAKAPASHLRFSREQSRETLLRAWRVLLGRSPAEALRDLFTHWLHARSARELVELRDVGVRVAWLNQQAAARSTDIAAENLAARQSVINILRRVPAGRWWSFGSLVDAVWHFQPDFLRGHQQLFLRPHWWLERLPDGQPLAIEHRADWRQGEGRYLALLVRRALHWLGVVDLALDTQGRLKGFRVTSLGASLLLGAAPGVAGESEAATLSTGPLTSILQPLEEGQVLLPLAGLNETTLETLLWWCLPSGATADGLRFLPSAACVATALDNGQSLESWLAWLEQSESRNRSQPLVEKIRRWAASYGQIRLYEPATLLEVADATLLPELEAALNLSTQFVDHLLAPGLAVLRPDAAESLIGELRRRGYDPWITTNEATD